ncbi:SRPBCC family protein [Nocardia nepalensis]|uniref:SRPBCC family protein n=1 Tax=Nocardia nepalensis TaxID=3375448 RepID=UPI003B675E57
MSKSLHKTNGVGKVTSHTVGRATETASRAGATARKTAQPPTPTSLLQQSVQHLAGTLAERAVAGLSNRVSRSAERLNDYAEGGGGNLLAAVTGVEKLPSVTSPLRAAATGVEKMAGRASPLQAAVGAEVSNLGHTVRQTFETVKESLTKGKRKGGAKKLKLTNIVEHIDVGVPIDLAYDQWTQFADFPKFTKKLERVEQVSDEKLSWTGKVLWSRRTWESTIIEQVPFERIVWSSKGAKGYIDGAVTFHEITPDLTRILVVLAYHPQGVLEKTANLWRAVGRRCRLELKHFQRYVMTEAVLHSDDIVGWHGEIHDGEVIEDDETARREEQADTEEDRAEEETDEADEHDEDQRELDEEEEPEPPRSRTAARKSTVTRRSRVSGGASR